MSLKENLQWRYATKKFDPTYKVTHSDVDYIQSCIQLAASSYGLQPYQVFRVENKDLRSTLKAVSSDQSQITDASVLFIFCSFTHLKGDYIERIMHSKGETQNFPAEKAKASADKMKKKLGQKSAAEQASWAAKQTYIALGNALMACAEKGLDACPMEGFDKQEYNRILNLEAKGLQASALLTVGKRSKDDATAEKPKYRREIADLFEVLD